MMPEIATHTRQVLEGFERRSGLADLRYEIRERPDKQILIIFVANPTERLFRLLRESQQAQTGEASDSEEVLATLKKQEKPDLLRGPEGRHFLRTLSESLNINRHSLKEDFFSRYTKSIFGAEEQIVAAANHVVFGRRGAGKSTLLLYGMNTRMQGGLACAWIDMQVYQKRSDDGVLVDILFELLEQGKNFLPDESDRSQLSYQLRELKEENQASEAGIRILLPDLRRLFSSFAAMGNDLVIFLDDFHVVDIDLQPRLLGTLYGIARGNNIFLKLSAIETSTRLWDPECRVGLEVPHDAQTIRLDYNLTEPDKASEHIRTILDAHANYCGLPSIRGLVTSGDVLTRLVWISAGVPRDALHIFSQAMIKATLASQKRISVTNVNIAASELIDYKLRDIDLDTSSSASELRQLLDMIKDFCVKSHKKNAFLVEAGGEKVTYQRILKLADLRLLHVINRGITVREAGRKYLALILDYGFYVGIRAARSVELFNKEMGRVRYKELRKLPVFGEE